jgi:hypothetical protein
VLARKSAPARQKTTGARMDRAGADGAGAAAPATSAPWQDEDLHRTLIQITRHMDDLLDPSSALDDAALFKFLASLRRDEGPEPPAQRRCYGAAAPVAQAEGATLNGDSR